MNEQQQPAVEREVTEVRRPVAAAKPGVSSTVIAQRVVWYIAGIIITFLALRIVLLMLGANQGNFFVDFVYAVGGFFAYPFQGVFSKPTYGRFYFDTASTIAIIVYALLAWGIARAFTLTNRQA